MSYLKKRLEKRLNDPEFKKAWEESEKEYQEDRLAILEGMGKMEKLVKNLSVRDYDEVEDVLYELLQEHYGIERYDFDSLEKDIEYVVGAINIVKLGDSPNTLKHQQYRDGEYVWSEDIPVSESYEYAMYYQLDKMNDLCKNTLSGRWSETYNMNRLLDNLE